MCIINLQKHITTTTLSPDVTCPFFCLFGGARTSV